MDHSPIQSTVGRWAGLRLALALLVLTVAASSLLADPKTQLDFGTDMASRGLWSEALFRFRQAEAQNPNDPRILNNIAVSLEALGLYEEALEVYRQAVETAPSLEHAKRNYARFVEFYQAYRGGEFDAEEGDDATSHETADADAPPDEGRPEEVGDVEKAAEEPTADEADAGEDEV